MKQLPAIATAILATSSFCSAQSPLASTVAPPPAKGTVATAAATGGAFLASTDDCAAPHADLGTGTQLGLPFDTSIQTTGTTGQNEANCLFFGTMGIANDGWGDWTASQNGVATVSTCSSTVDTKLAVYPLSTCPANGTSLSCSEDACGGNGLQSSVTWPITQGTTYTIQLGTFPGVTPGAGVFDIVEVNPAPCGQKDDGTTENALGWATGGELGWMTVWTTGPGTCLETWRSIEAAYGTLAFPGSVTNGASSKVVVYRDATPGDAVPTPTDLTIEVEVPTVVTNGDTDVLNRIPLGILVESATTGDVWALVSAEHVAGEFPAPLDQTPPTDAAGSWYVGSTTLGGFGGVLDTEDLADNEVPPTRLQSGAGVTANYLLRLGRTVDGGFTSVCFGDGSGAPCGCGNESELGSRSGCLNSVSVGGVGARLAIAGSPSVSAPDLTLTVDGVPTRPGLFFQGDDTLAGGAGATFGDGVRCCGGTVVRLALGDPPSGPEPATAATTLSSAPRGVTAGDTRCYQYWYRDPGGPCSSGFSLSSAATVTWLP